MCFEFLPWNYCHVRPWFCHIYGIWGCLFYACFVDDQQTQVRYITWIFNTTGTTVYLPVSGGF